MPVLISIFTIAAFFVKSAGESKRITDPPESVIPYVLYFFTHGTPGLKPDYDLPVTQATAISLTCFMALATAGIIRMITVMMPSAKI